MKRRFRPKRPPSKKELPPPEVSPSDRPEVLFSDNHIVVAKKPPGMLTQPNDQETESLQRFVKLWLQKQLQKEGAPFLHPIHRLDKPVSGLVLFAKTSKALSRLNEQARAFAIQRIYVAEVEGIVSPKLGQLDHFLIHGSHRAVLSQEGEEGAKHARLSYQVLHYMPESSLVQIELATGRYHQIRAQFSAIGHPVVGDEKYGAQKRDGFILLHSAKLLFEHPVTKERLSFESAAPFEND